MAQDTASLVRFSEREVDYILESRLARIATVSAGQQPHVVPIAYEFDGAYFYFCGWNLLNSLKARNIRHNNKVAIVIDDVPSTNPWRPRGIVVRGTAEIFETGERPYVRITPLTKTSWGLGGRRKWTR